MTAATEMPISNAIRRLTSTIKWKVANDYDMSTISWYDSDVSRPSDEAISAMRQTMADEKDAIAYIKNRTDGSYKEATDSNGQTVLRKDVDGYLPIADQLDMIYWDNVNGTTTWKDSIAATKAAHPKPSS